VKPTPGVLTKVNSTRFAGRRTGHLQFSPGKLYSESFGKEPYLSHDQTS
jgi:hypothetical protein